MYTRKVLEYLRAADLTRTKTVQVAASFGIHPDTLREHLANEGVSYMDLLHRVRIERLRESPALPHGELSERLGFSPHRGGGLSRWTEKYMGMTYSKFRQHNAQRAS